MITSENECSAVQTYCRYEWAETISGCNDGHVRRYESYRPKQNCFLLPNDGLVHRHGEFPKPEFAVLTKPAFG